MGHHRHDERIWGRPGGPGQTWGRTAQDWARGWEGWGPGRPGRGWVPPWAQPGPPPPPPPARSDVRIGNAERSEVTNALVRHLAEGRITEDELEERMEKANSAKTAADLAPLLADLPPLDGGPEAAEKAPDRPRRPWGGPLRAIVVALVVGIVALSTLGWAVDSARSAFWFARVPLIIFGVAAFALWRRAHGHRH